MKLLRLFLTLTVSASSSYAQDWLSSATSRLGSVSITVNYGAPQQKSHHQDHSQEIRTTALSLAYLHIVSEDLGQHGSVDREDLTNKLSQALTLLSTLNTTTSLMTRDIEFVSDRIKNDTFISETEKKEWAGKLCNVSNRLDDSVPPAIQTIAMAIVEITDISEHLENCSSVDRKKSDKKLDKATLVLRTLAAVDFSLINTIETVSSRIKNDTFISRDEKIKWAADLKAVADQLTLNLTH